MMDAQPLPSKETFAIRPATGAIGALVFASPHSGAIRPDDMMHVAGLSELSLRSAEDAGVDLLLADAAAGAAPLIRGLTSRAYVDLNRAPDEIDPALTPEAPAPAPGPATARLAAGYGVVARRTGDGRDLYDRPLPLDEIRRRLGCVHRPYHEALAELMQAAHETCGRAVLVDWHSMPSHAVASAGGRSRGKGPDVVLGDRHGSSCEGDLTRLLKTHFEAAGWTVSLNRPYAGGYTTRLWGRPEDGFHAVQVELNRALYLDEQTLQPSSGFARCRGVVSRVAAVLAAEYG